MRLSGEEGRGAGGVRQRWVELRLDGHERVELRVDPRFLDPGPIFAGPLIDPEATARRFGGTPGRRPEDWLGDPPVAPGAVAFCPTNFGWQHQAWLRWRGAFLTVPGDTVGAGPRAWLVRHRQGWCALDVPGEGVAPDVAWSRAAREAGLDPAGIALGLAMPALVRAGEAMGIESLAGHPRLLGDPRNVIDFSGAEVRGYERPPAYWAALRRLLPRDSATLQALLRGELCPWRVADLPPGILAAAVAQVCEHAPEILRAEIVDGSARLTPRVPLPPARLPLIGFGLRPDRGLVVVAASGRRAEVPGMTLAELAERLVQSGAETGWLGSAGGDVTVVQSTAAGIEFPGRAAAATAAENEAVTSREVPALLVAYP